MTRPPLTVPLGIYEKALPKEISWHEKLLAAREAGYSFVEMSVDESDERLARLDWSAKERRELSASIRETGVRIPSICLSGHRRFPFGSRDPRIREKARKIMQKALILAADLGVRTIQLAGYDVYYEESGPETAALFEEGLGQAVREAGSFQVMLAMETMDTAFMNSVTKALSYAPALRSPWYGVYPDVGNLSAWGRNLEEELTKGFSSITGVHLKDTLPVTERSPGQFRDVPFGEGCVDFLNVFRILRHLNYQGPFLLEMWTEKAENPLEEIRKAGQWMRKRMKEYGYVCHR